MDGAGSGIMSTYVPSRVLPNEGLLDLRNFLGEWYTYPIGVAHRSCRQATHGRLQSAGGSGATDASRRGEIDIDIYIHFIVF